MHLRNLFLKHLAPTSPTPLALEIDHAEGNFLITAEGKKLLDLIGGISVANVGHGNKEVIRAIKHQAEKYLHIMVYGELIQSPQVRYAHLLSKHLPAELNNVYFTNSGAEAVEGALKLAKKVTGRAKIFAAHNSYHGSTQGALSVLGDEYWRNAFRPLLPEVYHFVHGSQEFIDAVDRHTAAVLIEPIQAEAGIQEPTVEWMRALRERCSQTGTLLILDEIQSGFGRCGTLWAFEQFDIIPDVLLLGKALGGGMPLGAFIAGYDYMQQLSHDPVLGHITTFGGHPVSCAAGMAAFHFLLREHLVEEVENKGQLFKALLSHSPFIEAIRQKGLMIAVEFSDNEMAQKVIQISMEKGIFSDWFLFAPHCIRIAPPLTITQEEIAFGCSILLESISMAHH